MRGFPREKSWLAATLCAALACAGGGTPPRTCEDDAQCASGSRCVLSVCSANAPPVAKVTVPGRIATHALVTFDGSASDDADAPLDAVASYSWSFSAVDAPCPPPVSASIAPEAVVRFACPGRYAVRLTVLDAMGAPSAPLTREFHVEAAEAPAVQAGLDLATDHACSGTPLVCQNVDPIALGATLAGAIGEVTWSWTLEPPADRPLDASRRVRFEPGADVPNPTVVVESDGTAISGDWIFRVAARDAAGSAGEAAVRVVVRNRAPVITAKVPALPHAFDAKLSLFTASGVIPVEIVDPDGDPIVERAAVWRHTGDGDGQFLGVDTGDTLTVDVRVPYTAREDARYLIGDGVERTVELAVRDLNGEVAFQRWPIVIDNRPPGPGTYTQPPTIPHTYDAATATYLASGALPGVWTDPDGDPLFQGGPTGDDDCPSFTFTRAADGKQTPVVSCAVPFVTISTLENFAREHLVSVPVSDPWHVPTSATALRFTVADTPPTYVGGTVTMPSACTPTSTCCDYDPEVRACFDYSVRHASVSGTVSGLFKDADGDPILVSFLSGGTPASQQCDGSGEGCAFTVNTGADTTCGTSVGEDTFTVTAKDGANATSATLVVKMPCK